MLDLFCGAGGAAVGYYRAGFDVVGVDICPQPSFPFEFYQADALTFPLDGFDMIHASPPCQAYSIANHIHGRGNHPRLIEEIRSRIEAADVPYVIENVPGAPLKNPITLCGLSFGLNVKRHRIFETNFFVLSPPCGDHRTDYLVVFGGSPRRRTKTIGRTAKNGPMTRRGTATADEGRTAMGIDWMSREELSQAIPPAYTELIGRHAMRLV